MLKEKEKDLPTGIYGVFLGVRIYTGVQVVVVSATKLG